MTSEELTKIQFKRHKKYRWIALFFKLLFNPLFSFMFSSLTIQIVLPYIGTQTLGTFLATTLTLIVYYGIIFVLNRVKNFKTHTDLKKSLAVYILVILILMSIESTFSGSLQNSLYYFTNLGYTGNVISLSTVNNKLVYILIGFIIQFLFSFLTGIILFVLYKKVLTKPEVLKKI